MITKPTITQRALMPKESEETEVKNIEELKSWFEDDKLYVGEYVKHKINQLDEPEVLSREWIDDESMSVLDTFNRHRLAVPVDKLQNLLVPKQEEITEEQAWEVLSEIYDIPNKSYIREAMRVVADSVGDESTLGELKEQLAKPVIPQFVANWIEEVKPDNSLRVAFEYIAQQKKDNHDDELAFWVEEGNSETFARAWLDGYEVEETEYRRVLKVGRMYFSGGGDSQGNFVVELTDNRRLAHVFDDEEEAINMQNVIGGKVEELEE